MLGGLARRTAFVEKLKGEGKPVFVVDSGHLFFTDTGKGVDPKHSLVKARLISNIYKRMGAAAINIGDADLMQGLTFLRDEAFRGLPLTSANLVDPATKSPIFAPYIVKRVGKIRIAFFGLLSPYMNMNTAAQKAAGNSFLVKDPVETAREMIAKLHRRADIIILLSDLDANGEKEVIKAIPAINFVLGGHEGRYITSPAREGQTPVLASYRNGMYAGKLQLTVVKAGSSFKGEGEGDNRFLWTVTPLNASLPEDREVSAWIRKAGIGKD